MTIDRLNSMDPMRDPKKSVPASKTERLGKSDSISISTDASQKADLYQAIEIAKAAPDVRADKVAELKAKLQDPSYMNDAVLSLTADRIMDQLFGNG
jgi:negative regulator of flagellin synthesis FlgM